MDRIDSSTLRGRKVIDSAGITLGEVADVVIDPDHWHVEGLVVEVDREVADDLHIQKGFLRGGGRMEIGTDRIDALGESVLLNVDRDQIALLLRAGS